MGLHAKRVYHWINDTDPVRSVKQKTLVSVPCVFEADGANCFSTGLRVFFLGNMKNDLRSYLRVECQMQGGGGRCHRLPGKINVRKQIIQLQRHLNSQYFFAPGCVWSCSSEFWCWICCCLKTSCLPLESKFLSHTVKINHFFCIIFCYWLRAQKRWAFPFSKIRKSWISLGLFVLFY